MIVLRALLLAEKKSERDAIQKVYNDHRNEFDYDITFMEQYGHLLTLKLPSEIDEEQKQWKWENLPFHPSQYEGWEYKVIGNERARKIFSSIKEEIRSGKYDFIIHAGDSDQEGELLINIVINKIGTNLPVFRFWTNSQVEEDILKALKNMENDRTTKRLVDLYCAAQTRQHIDYLIGMNLSEASSLKMMGRVSVGRVKTPVCKIVYQREKEIQNFKPSTSYELESIYDERFKGVLISEDSEETNKHVRFKDMQELGEFIKKLDDEKARVKTVEKKNIKQNAPELYTLSSLQIEASQKYGYDGDRVLNIVQSLYEKKICSYPRTSCCYLGSNMDFYGMIKATSYIDALQPFVKKITDTDIDMVKKNKKYINDKAMEKEGHYALSPTGEIPNLDSLSKEEVEILTMIYSRFLAIFLPPLVHEKTQIITENNGFEFRSSGKILLDKGYTELLVKKEEDVILPDVKEGDIVHVKGFHGAEKTTVCPKRYTNGELLAVMEKPAKFLYDKSFGSLKDDLRLGTVATRAGILKQLIEKDKYLEEKKGKGKAALIHPTPMLMQIMERLEDRDICRVDMSGALEVNLGKIRTGEMNYKTFEAETWLYIQSMIEDIKTSKIKPLQRASNIVCDCPKPGCSGSLVEGKKGYFCSEWKNGCQSRLFKEILGAKITPADIKKMAEGGTIKKKLKKGDKSWEQELFINEDNLSIEFKKKENQSTNLDCPKCHNAKLFMTDWVCKCPSCDFQVFRKICGTTLSENVIQELFEKGFYKKELSFISKKGNKFKAKLIYNPNQNKIEFDFD